jgi:hypothetical protein
LNYYEETSNDDDTSNYYGDHDNSEKQCNEGCYPDWLGDEWCDPICNNAQCNYDSKKKKKKKKKKIAIALKPRTCSTILAQSLATAICSGMIRAIQSVTRRNAGSMQVTAALRSLPKQ